jgi:hypothetical protein
MAWGDSAVRGGTITAAAHRSKPLPAPRPTKLDMVFTYGIVAMRGTRSADLGTAAVRWFSWLRASSLASFGAPLVKMKAPKGAAVFADPSGMVVSAWAAAHRRGGELGRRIGFR